MSEGRQKILISIIAMFISVVVPIAILRAFFLLFPDFYSQGFLTGLGQMLVCGVIIICNAIFFPSATVYYFNKFVPAFGVKIGRDRLVKRIILFLVVSVVIQIVLSILVENPFKAPELPDFPM
ncbi:hypothetical protein [Paenibacillus sp. MMO-58]|uniref:hypothetical protein n=1 Tax=Paenibacillus sp. MMO-58 TaxID=3081290 RepID=UPI0030170CE7